jgi:hypothetical protein
MNNSESSIVLEDYFEWVEIAPDSKLRKLIEKVLLVVQKYVDLDEIGFGPIREGHTIFGYAWEITEDGINIDYNRLNKDTAITDIALIVALCHLDDSSIEEAEELVEEWGFNIAEHREKHKPKIKLWDFFERIRITSDYLNSLVLKTLLTILKSERPNQIKFGPLKEGRTVFGYEGEVHDDGLIILDSDELRQWDDDIAMAIVAHELAHSYHGHHLKKADGLEFENEADETARRWGFNIDKFREACGPAIVIK